MCIHVSLFYTYVQFLLNFYECYFVEFSFAFVVESILNQFLRLLAYTCLCQTPYVTVSDHVSDDNCIGLKTELLIESLKTNLHSSH